MFELWLVVLCDGKVAFEAPQPTLGHRKTASLISSRSEDEGGHTQRNKLRKQPLGTEGDLPADSRVT
jgi:hypothetical protein